MNLRLKLIQLLTRHRRVVTTALLVVSIVGGGYGLLRQRDQAAVQLAAVSPWRALASFTENGVTVAIALENDSSGQAWLVGTFTPVQEHFHLYSKDLPKDGIRAQVRFIFGQRVVELALLDEVARGGNSGPGFAHDPKHRQPAPRL